MAHLKKTDIYDIFLKHSDDVRFIKLDLPKKKVDWIMTELESDDYKDYKKSILNGFVTNIDLDIKNKLAAVSAALQRIPPDDPSYAKLLTAYATMLKVSTPIIDRVNRLKLMADESLMDQIANLTIELKN